MHALNWVCMAIICVYAIGHHTNKAILPAWHGSKDSTLWGNERMISCISAASEAWQVCMKQQKLLPVNLRVSAVLS